MVRSAKQTYYASRPLTATLSPTVGERAELAPHLSNIPAVLGIRGEG
jgi:hypothetical protein